MNEVVVPPIAHLDAPAVWKMVDFISDLHLQAQEPETFEAWRRFMTDTPADAVFILGDLFEVWVGDDAAREPGFASDCAAVLKATGSRLALFFMHGNRDFLVGHELLDACRVTLVSDPTVLAFAGQRWLLTHGDALCLDDKEYGAVRATVRTPQWQADFLAKPLNERLANARAWRAQSEARKRSGVDYGDVDSGAATRWLDAAAADTLIHGHTHKPRDHALGQRRRMVLSDWDARAVPPRLEALRVTSGGARRVLLS
jgi:UDP-2,3-diacylglucosamine hydrolase